ncbi:hypothetical protein AVEN_45186-1 [Araneus ventricosus]|uniref:Uncharacterized protein n=1 Tax=Araneus ventricosus TaxID=182803 RepID=A0A4Y2NHQ2_ARAVE|nr:hypothetical protein AVEN_45186-1 [Araneus ventricosus]
MLDLTKLGLSTNILRFGSNGLACSISGFNSIQQVWTYLGRNYLQMNASRTHPRSLNELEQDLLRECSLLPSLVSYNLIGLWKIIALQLGDGTMKD